MVVHDLQKWARLSIQKALEGEMTPQMVMASMEYSPRWVQIHIYHEGFMEEKQKEEFSEIVHSRLAVYLSNPGFTDPEPTIEFHRMDLKDSPQIRGELIHSKAN